MHYQQPSWIVAIGLVVAPALAQDAATNPPSSYQAALAVAEKAIRLDEIAEARRWLDTAPSSLRNWEWHYLDGVITESIDHAVLLDRVTALAVTPDGRHVVTGDVEGNVVVRTTDFAIIESRTVHDNAIYSIDISADGLRVATVSRDVTSRVLAIDSLETIASITLDNPGVAAAAFSPDGERVATCTWMRDAESGEVFGTVWIWNARTGDVVHRKHVGIKPLDSIRWTADGRNIIVGSWDGLVHILDDTATETSRVQMPYAEVYNAVVAVDISPDGRLIAAGSKDRTARVWSLKTGEMIATMQGHSGFVNDVRFTPDGARLITAGGDGTIRVWDAASGSALRTLREHVRAVDEIAVASDGSLYSVSRDATMRRWNPTAPSDVQLQIDTETDGTYTATFTPDGRRVVVATFDGRVLIFDATSGRLDAEWVAHAASCNTLSISADGSRVLTSSWDETARLWDINTHASIRTFNAGAGVYHGVISGDASLAALAVGGTLQIWSVESGERIVAFEGHPGGIRDIRFSRDGSLVYTAGADGMVGVWHVGRREREGTLTTGSAPVNSVALSRDGERIAWGDASGAVHCADASGEPMWSAQVADVAINRLAFHPDGSRLAAMSNAVDIIDAGSGDVLLHIRPHADTVWHGSFSPDGSRLATASTNGSVTISSVEGVSSR